MRTSHFVPFAAIGPWFLIGACITLPGCGSYEPRPLPQSEMAAAATTDTSSLDQQGIPGPQSGYGEYGDAPGGGQGVERRLASDRPIRRVPLTDAVGTYLNAAASIRQRAIEAGVKQVVDQYKAIHDEYPRDYEHLVSLLKDEGKEAPSEKDLNPGCKYVFDSTDGQLYVEGPG